MSAISVGVPGPAGVRWPNLVNGRLLTAQDLGATQAAVLGRDQWLGTAIGCGIAEGLEVSGAAGATALRVSPGTGVCPGGTAVHLDAEVTLDLTAVASNQPVTGQSFADCQPTAAGVTAPTAGTYILAMRPSSTYEGLVPVQSPAGATIPSPCTSRWEAETVRFVAVRLQGFTAPSDPALRQNALAHWCYGSAQLTAMAMAGFESPTDPRPLAAISDLTECDLALAAFEWDGSSLVFVDMWSVRRRPARPHGAREWWAIVADSRVAEGEARFQQFQHQLSEVAGSNAVTTGRADTWFEWLPPAGLVPIDTELAAEALFALEDAAPEVEEAPERLERDERDEAAERVRRRVREGDEGDVVAMLLEKEATSKAYGKRIGKVGFAVAALQAEIDELRALVEGMQSGRGSSGARGARRRLATELADELALTVGGGFDLFTFFAGFDARYGIVDCETVDFTIRRSWTDEAVPTDGRHAVDIFFVVDNATESVAPFVLFTKRIGGTRWLSARTRFLK